MFVIANNITTRNAEVNRLFREARAAGWDSGHPAAITLRDIADRCLRAGADALEINLQQHHDTPEAMQFAVSALEQVTDRRLCLSANKSETLEAGLKVCREPPIVNYISVNEARLREFFPLVALYGAEIVLLVSDPSNPGDAREMLGRAAVLIGAANGLGIPNERILVDPGIFHITREPGQRHLTDIMEFLRALPEAFDPPVRSTCWLTNSSAGAARRLRPVIETALFAMLAGLNLSSVSLDALRRENMRTVRLIRIFKSELIYTDSEAEL